MTMPAEETVERCWTLEGSKMIDTVYGGGPQSVTLVSRGPKLAERERVEVVDRSLLNEALEAMEAALAIPDTNCYGQMSDPGSVLRETREALQKLRSHLRRTE